MLPLRALLILLLATLPGFAFAAITPYTERGKADFDVLIDVLNPLGTWSDVALKGSKPTFRLCDPKQIPFTHGHWEYTDFGWVWIGAEAGSWGPEHYGWWTLGDENRDDNVWTWHPDGSWHTAPVDFRQTNDSIGWRASRLDEANEFVEKESDRYAKPEEWIWVPKAKFLAPLTAQDLIVGSASAAAKEQSKNLLLDSQAATHIYSAWRDIERLGPDPAKLLPVARVVPDEKRAPNQPNVVAYTLLCLPSYWAKLPPAAQPNQVYLYRPDFYQDLDGLRRRIAKWYAPAPTAVEKAQISQIKQSLQTEAEKNEGATFSSSSAASSAAATSAANSASSSSIPTYKSRP